MVEGEGLCGARWRGLCGARWRDLCDGSEGIVWWKEGDTQTISMQSDLLNWVAFQPLEI